MFTEESWDRIVTAVNKKEKTCLEVVIRTPFGPTAVEHNFKEGLKIRGINIFNTINWWSAGSSFGILEIETNNDYKLYTIWCQGKQNQILSITPKDDVNLYTIIDSFASSNVVPGVMRTFSHARFPGG